MNQNERDFFGLSGMTNSVRDSGLAAITGEDPADTWVE